MSNYIKYKDTVAFHPGYYIKEIVDDSGLTQEDFAKRLDTTPKNLSLLIRGEQSLSVDMAMKLSRMLGTSAAYWLHLQNAYDELITEFKSDEEFVTERVVFESLDYGYFRDNFGLPDFPEGCDEQIKEVRKFLNVATLRVLTQRDMAVSFRSSAKQLTQADTIKANAMVQIATNKALKIEAPGFNKHRFENAAKYALTLTENHKEFYQLIFKAFLEAGVIFIILPNISGSQINGATKKIGNNIMLMVNDRRLSADSFWFTLFHEIGHIMNGDYGISFDKETGVQEELANKYAEDSLIPVGQYQKFRDNGQFTLQSICLFANQIDRDPGIVLGRLQKDGIISPDDQSMKSLKHKYQIKPVI